MTDEVKAQTSLSLATSVRKTAPAGHAKLSSTAKMQRTNLAAKTGLRPNCPPTPALPADIRGTANGCGDHANTGDQKAPQSTSFSVLSCADHVPPARRWSAWWARFESSSPCISAEDKQIISTWAVRERGGEGDACQHAASVQIPADSSPAAPALPVIPYNKLQSKQGAQAGAAAATLSSPGSIFLPPRAVAV